MSLISPISLMKPVVAVGVAFLVGVAVAGGPVQSLTLNGKKIPMTVESADASRVIDFFEEVGVLKIGHNTFPVRWVGLYKNNHASSAALEGEAIVEVGGEPFSLVNCKQTGYVDFHSNGVVAVACLAKPHEVRLGGLLLLVGEGELGVTTFHDDGTLEEAWLAKPHSIRVGGRTLTIEGRITAEGGQLRWARLKKPHLIKSGSTEISIDGGVYFEDDRLKWAWPGPMKQQSIRMPGGELVVASSPMVGFHDGGEIANLHLTEPQPFMIDGETFTLKEGETTFHPNGNLKWAAFHEPKSVLIGGVVLGNTFKVDQALFYSDGSWGEVRLRGAHKIFVGNIEFPIKSFVAFYQSGQVQWVVLSRDLGVEVGGKKNTFAKSTKVFFRPNGAVKSGTLVDGKGKQRKARFDRVGNQVKE